MLLAESKSDYLVKIWSVCNEQFVIYSPLIEFFVVLLRILAEIQSSFLEILFQKLMELHWDPTSHMLRWLLYKSR